ncbi:MAG TPA: hypothetical protein PK869_07540 [Candidatus Hydrogenedentes bacterium]|nr:hypothetical protein [Candidatus Hydrogenedentota bacterium]
MNTSRDFKVPSGKFDGLSWMAFSGALAGNEFLHQLRATIAERDAMVLEVEKAARHAADLERMLATARGETAEAERELQEARAEVRLLKSAAERNAERVLRKGKRK